MATEIRNKVYTYKREHRLADGNVTEYTIRNAKTYTIHNRITDQELISLIKQVKNYEDRLKIKEYLLSVISGNLPNQTMNII